MTADSAAKELGVKNSAVRLALTHSWHPENLARQVLHLTHESKTDCPPGTKHVIVGAGDRPCVVFGVGARDRTRRRGWGGYTVDEAALRHGAGVEEATDDPKQAYACFRASEPTRYREGWLPNLG